jgi:hypothetical protein
MDAVEMAAQMVAHLVCMRGVVAPTTTYDFLLIAVIAVIHTVATTELGQTHRWSRTSAVDRIHPLILLFQSADIAE